MPDSTLDTSYVYDDPGVSFSLGRLTAIERGGATVAYDYDRFGRVTQDGALSYAYDENGNRTAVGYPGGVSATYGFDYADRAASLEVQVGADPPQTVVTSAGYLPSGPLDSLALGNGLAEQRSFDDGDETLTYTYGVNGAGGNTPQLLRIEPAAGVGEGAVDLGYDAAGDQTSWSGTRPEGAGDETILLSYGDDRRMSRIEDAGGVEGTDFLYDSRSFLREAHRALTGSTDFVRTEAVYSSEGVLHLRTRETQTTTPPDADGAGPSGTSTSAESTYLLYFAGRPVAQLIRPEGGTDQLVLLTTDHLGSPMLATDTAGAVLWRGGIAPFGEPYTLGDNTGGGDGDPPGSPSDEDDPNTPPPDDDPPAGDDGRDPPPPPPPPDDGRDLPPPPPGGGGDDGVPPDGRDQPPPPPDDGGDGGDPNGRPDPPPPPPPNDGRDLPPPPLPPPPDGGGGDPNGRVDVWSPAPGDGKALSLSTAEIFLRYPGQWDDSAWSGYVPTGIYYNVHRWYQVETDRYTVTDPLGHLGSPTSWRMSRVLPIDSRQAAICCASHVC